MGNLFLCWFVKDAGEPETRRAIIQAPFVYDLVGFIVTILTVFPGVPNFLGLSNLFVYLLFTIGFGYFLVKPPEIKAS